MKKRWMKILKNHPWRHSKVYVFHHERDVRLSPTVKHITSVYVSKFCVSDKGYVYYAFLSILLPYDAAFTTPLYKFDSV